MGGSGFLVDYDSLMNLGQQLANLRGEFSAGADSIAPLLGTISDSGLRGALHSFTTNWSDERAKLVDTLDRSAGFAIEAATAYRTGDTDSAQIFSGGSGG